MTQQLEMLEGTWEEIAAHAESLKGHRLQLLIFPSVEATPPTNGAVLPQESLAEALKDFIGSVSGPPTDMGACSEEYFARIMDEKHRRDLEKQTQETP